MDFTAGTPGLIHQTTEIEKYMDVAYNDQTAKWILLLLKWWYDAVDSKGYN